MPCPSPAPANVHVPLEWETRAGHPGRWTASRSTSHGTVSAVSYDSNAPVERTLRSFALNLTANPPLADLLNQARGEKVEVSLQPPQTIIVRYSGTTSVPSRNGHWPNARAPGHAREVGMRTISARSWVSDWTWEGG